MIPPDTSPVIAEYFVTDEGTLLFLASAGRSAPDVVRIDLPRDRLRAAAVDLFGDGVSPDEFRRADHGRWTEAFGPLIEPLADYCEPGRHVWIVPHDVLHRVPLHALSARGEYLMDRHPVFYTPSATVMRYCQAKVRHPGGRAVVFADSSDERPLVHARVQGAEIVRAFGEGNTAFYAGDAATEAALVRELERPGGVEVLHLACHGDFDAATPDSSGVLLAGGQRLTVARILELRMEADLVVLSACSSGMSRHRPGEELIGLTRSLIYAGASSVLVSLWPVDEIATSLLMRAFYLALKQGPDKALALRAAQRQVRDLTLAEVVAYGEQAAADLADADADAYADAHGSVGSRLQRDVAALSFQAGDFAAAQAGFDRLQEKAVRDTPWYREIAAASARCRAAARRSTREPDYSRRPFDHPYYWAAFILVGDWL